MMHDYPDDAIFGEKKIRRHGKYERVDTPAVGGQLCIFITVSNPCYFFRSIK